MTITTNPNIKLDVVVAPRMERSVGALFLGGFETSTPLCSLEIATKKKATSDSRKWRPNKKPPDDTEGFFILLKTNLVFYNFCVVYTCFTIWYFFFFLTSKEVVSCC